jgi:hypothetical protein
MIFIDMVLNFIVSVIIVLSAVTQDVSWQHMINFFSSCHNGETSLWIMQGQISEFVAAAQA